MLLNISDINLKETFDYCIVGAGPAGITIARKMASTGKKIILLEGGKDHRTEASQRLYQGEVIGDKYIGLAKSRLRYFGGSSNHWGGWCRPLNEEDFHAKGGNSHMEWPIKRAQLQPFLREASSILDISKIPQDKPFGSSGLVQFHFAVSNPLTRFAWKYKSDIFGAKNIYLVLDTYVTSFTTDGRSVTALNMFTSEGRSETLRAKTYVLATGGIENSRILLWSNALSSGTLIGNRRTLGKYWMEHPHFVAGEAILTGDAASEIVRNGYLFLSPGKKLMRETNTLNCGLRVEHVSQSSAERIISNLSCIAPRYAAKVVNLLHNGHAQGAILRAVWEQEPHASNRIELSDERDRFDVPKVRLYWRKRTMDRKTARTTIEAFARYCAEQNIGRVRLNEWVLGKADYPERDWLVGAHHMGGTRMASTIDDGIVDNNCKVFGQDNLYIAGSSVFPSSGYANPTLTIVQLALRLSEHLKKIA